MLTPRDFACPLVILTPTLWQLGCADFIRVMLITLKQPRPRRCPRVALKLMVPTGLPDRRGSLRWTMQLPAWPPLARWTPFMWQGPFLAIRHMTPTRLQFAPGLMFILRTLGCMEVLVHFWELQQWWTTAMLLVIPRVEQALLPHTSRLGTSLRVANIPAGLKVIRPIPQWCFLARATSTASPRLPFPLVLKHLIPLSPMCRQFPPWQQAINLVRLLLIRLWLTCLDPAT